jgi:hypothetical protein
MPSTAYQVATMLKRMDAYLHGESTEAMAIIKDARELIDVIRAVGINQEHEIMRLEDQAKAPWYLLYDGSSADGMGQGQYVGRTTDEDAANKHADKCRKNPYSTGRVMKVTDTSATSLM